MDLIVHHVRQVTWLLFDSLSNSSFLIYLFVCVSQLSITTGSSPISCSQRSSDGQWTKFAGREFAVGTLLTCRCSNDGKEDTVTGSWIHPDTKMASVEYNIDDGNITFQYTSQDVVAFIDVHITCMVWNHTDNELIANDSLSVNMRVPTRPMDPMYISDDSEIWLVVTAISFGALSFILLVIFAILCVVVSRNKRQLQEELMKEKTPSTKGRHQSQVYVERSPSDGEVNQGEVNQSVTITISPQAGTADLENGSVGTSHNNVGDHRVSVKISDTNKVPNVDGTSSYDKHNQAIRGRTNSNEAFQRGISVGELKQHRRIYRVGSSPPELYKKDDIPPELPPREKPTRDSTPLVTTRRYEENTIGRASMVDEVAPFRNRIQSTPAKQTLGRDVGGDIGGDLPPTVPPRNFMSLPRPTPRRKTTSNRVSAAPW